MVGGTAVVGAEARRGHPAQAAPLNFSFLITSGGDQQVREYAGTHAEHVQLDSHAMVNLERPVTRVVSLHPACLDPDVGVEIIKVQPHAHPTLSSVVSELELHPPMSSPTPFYWVIGDTKEVSQDALDHVCVSLIEQPFRDVTVANDSKKKKVQWRQGVLNCHVSRFEMNPENPLKVDRHAVEILMAPHGLVTVDQNGASDHLMALRGEIAKGRVSSKVSSCIGALASKVVEEQLLHNEAMLDHLETYVDQWRKLTLSGPLLDEQVHEMLPTLTDTIAFIARKVKQTEDVFVAMEEAARDNPHFFGSDDPKSYLMSARKLLDHVVSHAESMLSKLERVEGRHDRQMTSKGDKNIERFTFLLGVSAPPMMADIACKMLLPDHHELHAPIALASFIVGVGLVAIALLPDWLHERQLRHGQEVSELGGLAHEIRSGRRNWLNYSYKIAEHIIRSTVVEPAKWVWARLGS